MYKGCPSVPSRSTYLPLLFYVKIYKEDRDSSCTCALADRKTETARACAFRGNQIIITRYTHCTYHSCNTKLIEITLIIKSRWETARQKLKRSRRRRRSRSNHAVPALRPKKSGTNGKFEVIIGLRLFTQLLY